MLFDPVLDMPTRIGPGKRTIDTYLAPIRNDGCGAGTQRARKRVERHRKQWNEAPDSPPSMRGLRRRLARDHRKQTHITPAEAHRRARRAKQRAKAD